MVVPPIGAEARARARARVRVRLRARVRARAGASIGVKAEAKEHFEAQTGSWLQEQLTGGLITTQI